MPTEAIILQGLVEKQQPLILTLRLLEKFEESYDFLQVLTEAINFARATKRQYGAQIIMKAAFLKKDESRYTDLCLFLRNFFQELQLEGEQLKGVPRWLSDGTLNLTITSLPWSEI